MKTKMKGIYGFRNVHTDKWYIGQSKNIEQRYEQHIKAVDDVKFHQALREYPDLENDWDCNIIIENDNFTDEQLDQLEAAYIALHNACAEGYNSTNGNHPERIDGMAFVDYNKQAVANKLYLVNTALCGYIYKKIKHPAYFLEGTKKVLFIRNFEQADWFTTLGNDVTVITDLKGHVVSGANMVVTDNIKKELKDMSDKKFDLIIANPPYGKIGADITKFIVDNFEFEQYLNLLPANDYTRTKELINHVNLDSLEMIKGGFDDASVNTHIAEITKKRKAITKEAFTLFTYDENLQRCYETFANREHYAIDKLVLIPKPETVADCCYEKDFMITARTVQNGVHTKKNSWDIRWNILKDCHLNDLPIEKTNNTYQVGFLRFQTSEERDNFCKWWYEGKLANMLIKGLNKTGGNCKPALPKVDWTRPWTDEQILKDCGYTDEEIEELLK